MNVREVSNLTYIDFELGDRLTDLRRHHQPQLGQPLTPDSAPDPKAWMPRGYIDLLVLGSTSSGACFRPNLVDDWITPVSGRPSNFTIHGSTFYLQDGQLRSLLCQLRVMTKKAVLRLHVLDLLRLALASSGIIAPIAHYRRSMQAGMSRLGTPASA